MREHSKISLRTQPNYSCAGDQKYFSGLVRKSVCCLMNSIVKSLFDNAFCKEIIDSLSICSVKYVENTYAAGAEFLYEISGQKRI